MRGETGAARAARIEAGMRKQMKDKRCLPYIQVHEFEALLFSDLDALAGRFPDEDGDAAAKKLRQGIAKLAPEEVDDGQETAPSKRIRAVLPSYTKPIDGPTITAQIGIAHLRVQWPRFGTWVETLEQLAAERT